MSDPAPFPKPSEALLAVRAKGVGFMEGPAIRGYLAQPIPNALDGEMGCFLEAYRQLSMAERQIALTLIKPAHTSVLRCYAERMGSLSVRLNAAEPATRGVLALGLAYRAERDAREIWLVMAVVFDAIRRCGENARAVFRHVARLLPQEVAEVFERFTERSDLDNIAAVMGYVDTTAEDGFRYNRTF